MPACTQLSRVVNGETELVSLRWGYWHIECLQLAIADEGGRYADGKHVDFFAGFLNGNAYTFRANHRFVDTEDGEVFEIRIGDVYSSWRE